jgi:hypothetical protein
MIVAKVSEFIVVVCIYSYELSFLSSENKIDVRKKQMSLEVIVVEVNTLHRFGDDDDRVDNGVERVESGSEAHCCYLYL